MIDEKSPVDRTKFLFVRTKGKKSGDTVFILKFVCKYIRFENLVNNVLQIV